MDKSLLGKRCLFLLLTFLFIMMSVRPVPTSHAIAQVYLYPSTTTDVDPPSDFKVDVKIASAANIFAFEFKLSWNSSVLNFLNVTEGSFLKGVEQIPTYFVDHTYQDNQGPLDTDYIGVAVTRIGNVMGVSGGGILATVAFDVEVKGETVLDLFDVVVNDSVPKAVPSTSTDGFFTNIASSPRPIFTYTPTVARIDEIVIFNATTSFDPDGTIVSYFWNFTDGTTVNEADPITTHAFSTGGNHTVALTVTDNMLLNRTGTQIVKVRHNHNIMVTAITASRETVTAGDTVEIQVTVVNDGVEPESFSVTAYYGTNPIGNAHAVDNMAGFDQSQILTFTWETAGAAPDTYRIKAVASTIAGETETTDNSKLGGTVTVAAAPSLPWAYIGAGVAVAAICVVGLIFFMRRKKA